MCLLSFEILSAREDKIRIPKWPCNILYIFTDHELDFMRSVQSLTLLQLSNQHFYFLRTFVKVRDICLFKCVWHRWLSASSRVFRRFCRRAKIKTTIINTFRYSRRLITSTADINKLLNKRREVELPFKLVNFWKGATG